ncbi:hypothetical protein HPB49_025201 [Dermacentor silvarum]|uniref:Uncharacterized protein n=1 Tax=Dermacentor silvarum TaxID=543639 RepID=A0ACB8E3Y4_DERSI|nr:hypothetical protein HPB49_025201 [Dermacentor silvarum]
MVFVAPAAGEVKEAASVLALVRDAGGPSLCGPPGLSKAVAMADKKRPLMKRKCMAFGGMAGVTEMAANTRKAPRVASVGVSTNGSLA